MAHTHLRTRKAQIYCAPETTQDTFKVPVLGDVFLGQVEGTPWTADGANFEPNYARTELLKLDEQSGDVSASMKFRVPIKGSGAAGTAPEWRDAIMGCGFKEALSAGVSVIYTPCTTYNGSGGNPAMSYSVGFLEDGIRYGVKGAYGNVVFSGGVGAGEPAWMDFTFTGGYVAPADVALLVPVYDTSVAPAFRGASMTFGGITPKGINKFSLDVGNQVVLGRDVNDATGIYGSRIVDRKSIGTIDPELVLIATHDWFGLWRSGTVAVFGTGVIGSTAGNRWKIDLPRVSRRQPQLQNRDNMRVMDAGFAVSSALTDTEAANPDITLTLT